MLSFVAVSALCALVAVAASAEAPLCARAQGNNVDLISEARSILSDNWVDSMNSTLPSPNLYPHQWSWDSAFIAMGYSHYDTQRAVAEMNALYRGQWRNGHIPHIVFNPSATESYFPAPAFWKLDTAGERGPVDAQTSGITQPAVHATATLAIYENAVSDEDKALAYDHLVEVYPKLSAWHDYLYNERDPLNQGLVFVRHMWESGMDNSPAWDPVMANMELGEGDVPPYKRVDKKKVGNVNERPNTYFYDRAVHLIKKFYDHGYDEKYIFEHSSFLVQDVLFNSILAKAGHDLAAIATILGKDAEAAAHAKRADWTAQAITDNLYDEEDGFFYNYDMVAKTHIKKKISGGLAAVYGAKLEKKHLDAIVKALYSPGFLGEDLSSWTIPSVSKDDEAYTNTTYWKGPAWININYLVRDGLVRNAAGRKDVLNLAEYLKSRSLELISKSGFYEYFNPISGSPHGGHRFSWSAALAIDWVCAPDVVPELQLAADKRADRRSKLIAMGAVVVFLATAMLVASQMSARAENVAAVKKDTAELDDEQTNTEVITSRLNLRRRAPRRVE